MGKVQQRAGGGRVTTENLTAENILNGVTVSIRQGSKTVKEVTGALEILLLSGLSFSGSEPTYPIGFMVSYRYDGGTFAINPAVTAPLTVTFDGTPVIAYYCGSVFTDICGVTPIREGSGFRTISEGMTKNSVSFGGWSRWSDGCLCILGRRDK